MSTALRRRFLPWVQDKLLRTELEFGADGGKDFARPLPEPETVGIDIQ
jgi:hypothetical protein